MHPADMRARIVRLGRLVLGATVLGLFASFGAATDAAAQKRGGILEYGVKAEAETFDIHSTNAYGVMHFLPQHYSTLLTFDWKNFPKLEGDLAESWDVSKDSLTYTFKLRRNVQFHDGTPFTSKDVKATFDRLRKPPEGIISARKVFFESIDTIDTPDDYTVVFKLKQPDAFMLHNFGSPYNAIYAAKDIEKPGNWHQKNINGTGPFVFVEQTSGEKWVTKRNEKYHHDDVYLDGTIGYRIKDITNPLVGGQIMAEFRSVSPPERENIQKQMGDKVTFQEKTMLTEWTLSLNTKFKPFEDKRVRQALNLCIDRYEGLKKLAKVTFTSPKAGGHLLPGSPWALPDKELQAIPGYGPDAKANRAKARELLKAAGHEGLEFTYSNRSVSHPYDHIAIFLIAQWKACGLNPKMVASPTAKFVTMRRQGAFDVTIDWNSNFLPDPVLMHQKYISADRNPQNYSGHIDRKLDELFDAQRREPDPEKRKQLVQEFERRVLEAGWTIPISYTARVIALNSKVKGYEIAYSHVLNTDWRGVWLDDGEK